MMNPVSPHSNIRKASITIILWMLLLFVSVETMHGSRLKACCSPNAATTMSNDTSVVNGTDINGNGVNEDELPEDINVLLTSLSSPTSRDTLRTYTLNGMCVKGAAKSQPTRTLYNIIIKNGRKVLKR